MILKSLQSLISPEVEPFAVLRLLQRVVAIHAREGNHFMHLLENFLVRSLLHFPFIGGYGHIFETLSGASKPSKEMIFEIFDVIFFMSFSTMLLVIGAIYCVHGIRLFRVVHKIKSETYGTPQDLRNEFTKSNIKTLTVLFGISFFDVSLSTFYYVTQKFCVARMETKDRRFRCGYQSPVWYPFQEDTVLKEWIIRMWWGVGENITLSIYVSTIYFLFTVVRFIPMRLKHLRSRVESIDLININISDFSRQIKLIAMYYIEILQCVQGMKDSLGYCLVGTYTFTKVVLPMLGYLVLLGNYDKAPSWLLCSSAIAYICTLGQNWEDEHEKLVMSVTNLHWYILTPKQRKEYLLLLGTVQIPVHLIAKPNVAINNILLVAVSYASIVQLTERINKIIVFLNFQEIRTIYTLMTFLSKTTK